MSKSNLRKQNRLYIAFALFLTSIFAAFAISVAANKSQSYWVITRPLPAGVQITSSDLTQKSALISFTDSYLRADTDPVGLFTTRNILEGEILTSTALTKENDYFNIEEVSISIRASDIPGNTDVGDLVTIYQVGDSRNGETIEAPIRILSGVFVSALERKGSNFGSELSITLAISHEYVPRVLSATDRGRIVIVGSHGR